MSRYLAIVRSNFTGYIAVRTVPNNSHPKPVSTK